MSTLNRMPGGAYNAPVLSTRQKLVASEREHALRRAQKLWGDTAWVMNQSDIQTRMFMVSAGKHPSIRAYGEGESWDEAFVAAGESLFASQPNEWQPSTVPPAEIGLPRCMDCNGLLVWGDCPNEDCEPE